MNLEQAAATFVAKHRDDRIDVDHINDHFGSVEKYLESIAEYATGQKIGYVEISSHDHINGCPEVIEWADERADDLELQNERLKATIETLEDKLKLAEASQERDAETLETLSQALMSIIEDKVNDVVDARLGYTIENAIDDELENRDLVSRYDFNDLFDEALGEVEVSLSR